MHRPSLVGVVVSVFVFDGSAATSGFVWSCGVLSSDSRPNNFSAAMAAVCKRPPTSVVCDVDDMAALDTGFSVGHTDIISINVVDALVGTAVLDDGFSGAHNPNVSSGSES